VVCSQSTLRINLNEHRYIGTSYEKLEPMVISNLVLWFEVKDKHKIRRCAFYFKVRFKHY
jgi:hypothetical protein